MNWAGLQAALTAVLLAVAGCSDDSEDPEDLDLCGGDAETIDDETSPAYVATDGMFAYWTTTVGGVRRAPLAGGEVTDIAVRDGSGYAIAVAGEFVYFTDFSGGAVLRVPTAGGEVRTIATEDIGPYAIVADGARAYWINRELGTLRAADHASGAVTTLATDLEHPLDIALAGDALLIAEVRGVVRVPVAGGATSVLSDRGMPAYAIAVDSASVYWVEEFAGLFRAPLAGGPSTQVAAVQSQFGHMATDGAHVWFTDTTNDTLLRAPAAGGSPDTLCTGLDNPIGVAIGGGRVFVTDSELDLVVARPQ
jgi:hypothetical protein